jgi:hypothetical protein
MPNGPDPMRSTCAARPITSMSLFGAQATTLLFPASGLYRLNEDQSTLHGSRAELS